jgi:hypothetical protein
MKAKRLKFKTNSLDHSEAIQKRLFELGYRWSDGSNQVINADVEFLFASDDLVIGFSRYPDYFKSAPHAECTLQDLYLIKKEEPKEEKTEQVFIDKAEITTTPKKYTVEEFYNMLCKNGFRLPCAHSANKIPFDQFKKAMEQ